MHTPTLAVLLSLLPLAACAAAPDAPQPATVPGVAFQPETAIVQFPVRSIASAQAWYARVLGASVIYELPEQGWCEMTTPAAGTLFGLHEVPGASAGEVTALGLGVDDMSAAHAWLVKHGVRLEGDVVTIPGVVKLLYFRDPDGNRMWFYEPLAE